MNKLPKIIFFVIGDKITARLGGRHKTFKDLDEERRLDLVSKFKLYQTDPREETFQDVLEVFSPLSKTIRGVDSLELGSNGKAYLKGTNTAMPDELAELISSYTEQGLDTKPLVNFWILCMLNPNPQARQDFFRYVQEYGILLTDNGYVILYKAVNKSDEFKGKVNIDEFVTSNFIALKDDGKDPDNHEVYEGIDTGEFRLSLSGIIPASNEELRHVGNLGSLKDKVSVNEDDQNTVFVPQHSGDHGMEIIIGETVEMPRHKCDPDISVGCSYGLHVGSYDYVSSFGRGMDNILAILVNPKDIVALPKHDNSKIRTCRYFPYAVIERSENGDWSELESDYFEEDFMDYEQTQILEQLDAANQGDYSLEEDRELDISDTEVRKLLSRRLQSINN